MSIEKNHIHFESPKIEVSDVVGCLKLLSEGKRVVIDASKETEALASTDYLFSYIDPVFKDLERDESEQETPEVAVEIYEQIEDAEYPKIFRSLSHNLDELLLTTPQIKNFVVNHAKDYLLENEEWTCFRFLIKKGEEFFIVDVRVLSDGDRALRVTRFLDGSVRHAKYHHRIVVPKVANLS